MGLVQLERRECVQTYQQHLFTKFYSQTLIEIPSTEGLETRLYYVFTIHFLVLVHIQPNVLILSSYRSIQVVERFQVVIVVVVTKVSK